MLREKRIVVRYAVTGLLISTVAMLLAFLSAGAGDGNYALARLLFPYSMLLTLITGDHITGPLLAGALAQFPSYGLILGVASLLGKVALWITLAAIVIIHLSSAAACFSGLLPNFSG
ncbi:MAG TPA: hypothetical protein VGQ55_12190 [Pyrinomonadaceae bacterium]|jgi:hypothetical protein|nr:hypothetical protein [Pyrinomonadaceae bacterium]